VQKLNAINDCAGMEMSDTDITRICSPHLFKEDKVEGTDDTEVLAGKKKFIDCLGSMEQAIAENADPTSDSDSTKVCAVALHTCDVDTLVSDVYADVFNNDNSVFEDNTEPDF
jgi:hypothetical protein